MIVYSVVLEVSSSLSSDVSPSVLGYVATPAEYPYSRTARKTHHLPSFPPPTSPTNRPVRLVVSNLEQTLWKQVSNLPQPNPASTSQQQKKQITNIYIKKQSPSETQVLSTTNPTVQKPTSSPLQAPAPPAHDGAGVFLQETEKSGQSNKRERKKADSRPAGGETELSGRFRRLFLIKYLKGCNRRCVDHHGVGFVFVFFSVVEALSPFGGEQVGKEDD